jgi:hypothetical protein
LETLYAPLEHKTKTVKQVERMPNFFGTMKPHTQVKHPHRRSGQVLLLWMTATLTLYIAAHSPLRETIAAAFGMSSRGCFFCTYSITIKQVIDSISAIGLISAALLAALAIAEPHNGATYEKAIVLGLGGFALITIPAAIIGEAADIIGKTFLSPPAGPLLAAIPATIIIARNLARGWRPHRPRMHLGNPSLLVVFLACLIAILFFIAAAVSFIHPPTGYDALSYHGPMSIYLWRDGSLGAFLNLSPSYWPLAHPGTAELWFGLLQVAGGEALSKIAQFPFALLGAVGVYAFSRRLGLDYKAGQLAAAAFLLTPMVLLQSFLKLNDLIGASMLIAAIGLSSAPMKQWNAIRLAFIGLALGLAVTIKLVLIPGAAAVGFYVLIRLLSNARYSRTGNSVFTCLAFFAVSFLIVVAPWWTRNFLHFGNPVYPVALPLIGRGFSFENFNKADLAFVPRPAAWLIYPLIELHSEQSGLGALFSVCALVGFAMAAWKGRRKLLNLFVFVTVVMVVAWWFLSERFPRFLLAPAGLAAAFVPWSLLTFRRHWRSLGIALVSAAALFSAWVTFDQALLPFSEQPITRLEFYNQVWGVDPAVQSLPEDQALFFQTGYAPGFPEYAQFYPLLGQTFERFVLTADRESTTGSIVDRMHRNGIQYAYVSASPGNRRIVEKLFDSNYFELVSQSSVIRIQKNRTQRPYYRPSANAQEKDSSIQRYLFRLK